MKKIWVSAVLAAGLAAPVQAQEAADKVAPEMASGISDKQMVTAQKFMVVAANPHASKAGFDVLQAGGNAIDAMVAVQLVLGLVEPQSSGIGGGAFLVYYDAETGELTTFDGRETAPASATPSLFQDENGEPLKFFDAVVGGLSVGTPGTVRLLHDTHAKLGSLPWADLVAPAIKLATDGFEVSPRLNALITQDQEQLSRFEATKNYFVPDGKPLPVGYLLKNPAYAATLMAISQNGADGFYTGDIAKSIIETVRTAKGNPGTLALEDLARYEIKERPAICAQYRAYEVCGMGPPSSGALTVGQILGQLNTYDLPAMNSGDPQAWRLIGDASRLAFADRGRYMADSDFVPMPTQGLIDPAYLKGRAELLSGDKALPADKVAPGNPTWDHTMLQADDESIELPSTSHFSIVDADGNAISMTTTIENGFGSRLMTNGFLLNNELTDFSFRTNKNGVPIANRVEPGKRPRSSMSPTIVMKDDKPVVVVGSPGGSRIIGYVAATLVANLDWGMNIQDAISMPHLINRFGTYDLEKGTAAEKLQPALEAMGYKTNIRDLNSGLHGIVITRDGLQGGADPRREGLAIGE
ncbi:Gamma-glutamyltranspeptidase precursor [Pseudovibrio axinellae]|uniref:Glutathione hydrolase proenzyme n=1 Tax=Pseudovibrio axinellae TaxID=989403 RepID=A0A165YVQ8_9HYPH|nr:gamma-glutamyltransferase [Pseudovibrio axinellae]KZL19278.1 Gamma-glutamyltranspeptidase precursor [Pseudovibrio axinellae]SEQ43135.1 gamma-glutamyltranspeptidase / glutathione hydrolase [Pseudovibrio axinellae]